MISYFSIKMEKIYIESISLYREHFAWIIIPKFSVHAKGQGGPKTFMASRKGIKMKTKKKERKRYGTKNKWQDLTSRDTFMWSLIVPSMIFCSPTCSPNMTTHDENILNSKLCYITIRFWTKYAARAIVVHLWFE